jgi:hypothetical protein
MLNIAGSSNGLFRDRRNSSVSRLSYEAPPALSLEGPPYSNDELFALSGGCGASEE